MASGREVRVAATHQRRTPDRSDAVQAPHAWAHAFHTNPKLPARAKETAMLSWALTFFILALVAALFGFGGIAAGAASIAQILFFVFLVLLVLSLFLGRRRVPLD